MGLAASQARLLLLTARKSDLEYRAQMISQTKLSLAMETEGIAKKYTKALNNTTLTFEYFDVVNDPDAQKATTEVLNYQNFCNKTGSQYRLRSAETGKVVCLSLDEASRYVNKDNYLLAKGTYYEDDNGKAIKVTDGVTVPAGKDTFEVNKDGLIVTGEGENVKHELAYDEETYQKKLLEYQATMDVLPALDNKDWLQQALQSGLLIIEKVESGRTNIGEYKNGDAPVTKKTMGWTATSLSGMSDVATTYDTSDDGAAEATYQYESLRVQTKDKQLDVELKQIETQQKACESELESVKKVIQKNVETSFKYFS
ncbi:hypothetical protein IJE86_08460 [bacterium]|nr:hypothetical protein [bacterium]